MAWVLGSDNVAAAIVGASRPDQIHEVAAAVGVRLDAGLRTAIDDVLGDIVVRDPALTRSPSARP